MNLVAVIGLGNIATRHRKNIKKILPAIEVIAVSSRGGIPEHQIDYADKILSNIYELVSIRPDFVIIASPSTLHAKHAAIFIEVGIPVLIEKPVTASLDDAAYLCCLSQQYDTPIAVGYCLRYMPAFTKMKSLLDADAIGHIYNCFINVGQYLPDWRSGKDYTQSVSATSALGGGALLELSHEFDYVQCLLGGLKVEYAQVRQTRMLNLDVEEIADVILTNDKGTVCNIHLDFLQKPAQRVCSFIGSKGRIDWDLAKNSIQLHHDNGIDLVYSDPDWDRNEMYVALIEDFIQLITGKPNRTVSLQAAHKTIELVGTIKKLAVKGVKI